MDLATLCPNQKWLLWIKGPPAIFATWKWQQGVFSAVESGGTRCDQVPSCSRAQLDPNTHLQMWHSSHSISMGTKTPNQELPSATEFGFTVAGFRAGLSGDLFPLQLLRKDQHFQEQPRSAASGALQALGRGEWGNQCYSSKVIRQPQITAQEGLSGPKHTRDFAQGFFLVVVLEFLWANMKLPPLWNQV